MHRLTALPPGLRQTIFSPLHIQTFRTTPRNASVWTQRLYTQAHNAATDTARKPWSARNYLWLLPVAGGFALYLSPRPQSIFPALLSSPVIIPCNEDRKSLPDLTINSPLEPKKSIVTFILTLLHDKIWEPILTTRRFIHLLYLFLPVLFTAPMLLVGTPQRALRGDRWGAVWWYGFLTAQMQRAGPTFVKVCLISVRAFTSLNFPSSWRSGLHRARICSPLYCATDSALSILKERRIRSPTPSALSSASSSVRLTRFSRSSTRPPSGLVLSHRCALLVSACSLRINLLLL